MIKQIFIAPLRENIDNNIINKVINEMRNMKSKNKNILNINVNKSLDIMGIKNAIVMIIDLKDKTSLIELLNSNLHKEISNKVSKIIKTEDIVTVQI
ncbi:hypothetical protein [Apilactobacillus quenuiae]|uniref:hypothetical protein n=1 Tax=Apilactobacillus quenuiae TaxID=2008377 RepID=UPI000D013C4E|nr:hypothetical protein [Apilactobacillus quenuiae]